MRPRRYSICHSILQPSECCCRVHVAREILRGRSNGDCSKTGFGQWRTCLIHTPRIKRPTSALAHPNQIPFDHPARRIVAASAARMRKARCPVAQMIDTLISQRLVKQQKTLRPPMIRRLWRSLEKEIPIQRSILWRNVRLSAFFPIRS